MDARVRECAQTLQDEKLLAKLSAGDLVAQEAKYHAVCLASLYQKGKLKSSCYSHKDDTSQSIALAELIEYIEDYKLKSNTAPIFKLCDLTRLYATRLEQMGVSPSGRLHSTRLKERLLKRIPGLKAYTEGRDVLLAFDKDIGIALKKAEVDDSDNEASHLIKVAKMVRRDMFQLKNTFEGSFSTECQDDSVPDSLVTLVAMVLEGPSILDQNEAKATSQQVLSIAQLIKFNCRNRLSKEQKALYHTRDHETPLPIYIGLDVYAQTRKRELVETLHKFGISISYERVLAISTDLANTVCQQYQTDGTVCPLQIRNGLFTTAAIDNIDHNLSSSTAQASFHGTGISLFQNSSKDCMGGQRQAIPSVEKNAPGRGVTPLPESYTVVPPVVLKDKNPPVPPMSEVTQTEDVFLQAISEEYQWLEQVQKMQGTETVSDQQVTWPAFHANILPEPSWEPSITALLPLFHEDSKSVAMMHHALNIIRKATDHVNPGQIPVVTVDQPFYVLVKLIQWNWQETPEKTSL